MDPIIVLILIGAIVGPAILFVLKVILIGAAATVVASALSPTVVVKEEKRDGQNNK